MWKIKGLNLTPKAGFRVTLPWALRATPGKVLQRFLAWYRFRVLLGGDLLGDRQTNLILRLMDGQTQIRLRYQDRLMDLSSR